MGIQQVNGQWGEELAVGYLIKEGFEIIARNWKYKRAEVDIIAKEKDVLVFIEVKTRASTGFGRPEEMVGPRKKQLLIDSAMAYMRSVGYDWEIRFDILAILGEPGRELEIRLFRDAFFPGLDYV